MTQPENELRELEDKIANLIIGWSIEVSKMPRGKTISAWVSTDIMELIAQAKQAWTVEARLNEAFLIGVEYEKGTYIPAVYLVDRKAELQPPTAESEADHA